MVCAYSLTSNSIIWKRLGCGRFYLPVSSYGYTHDVLLHQPCMCNNNDRAARLIKFPITDTASCKTKKFSIFSVKSTFLIFSGFASRRYGGSGVIFHVKLRLEYSLQGCQYFLRNVKIQLRSEYMTV